MSGTVAQPEGVTNPPIDRLLETVDSKYALVLYSAKRARQINSYYSQMEDGLLEHVGPLIDTDPQEKPLSIALREIDEGLLTAKEHDDSEPEKPARQPLKLGDDAPEAPISFEL
ncbi:DNA-directed RNA polymerase subunit omega [Helcobacillus massiliensis]|uniref:DNA-directed RNA polymerase subunit omega n=1 Tax=Helcobacillus massiliensis TaxID=521392 RepID=A0A839QQP4_9MICO|nr:DNA-directed RNA polymerase subunit omega [Helcobacillus massiliensis]MCG7426448.1 DNA-directed RNA polymerase subunit omega [Helcobacillus sp. ACRRO]MBB3022332.1 DNA-directed RNA polymerase subunit omega [Helcobacillus massiliensis]MCT1556971.1 DNA-directed RNA polymerase subunit omega [Helcobacillus massiliensis]MCT2035360.1 DNA-directed RNA polymerase subunit omega [Helcobacillus massiliensis]MCT2331425.1 DNA-directed RNA polymerase subunit omega [Helcobacillus massiliensis]